MASKVSASSLSSSRGPSRAIRSSSVSSETQHATGDEPAQQDRQQGHRGEGDGVLDAQAVQGVVGHLALDGAPQLVGWAGPDGHVVGRQVVAHQDVADGQQRGSGKEEDPGIEQGHPQADRRVWHQTR